MHGKVRQSLIDVLVCCGLVGYGGVLMYCLCMARYSKVKQGRVS